MGSNLEEQGNWSKKKEVVKLRVSREARRRGTENLVQWAEENRRGGACRAGELSGQRRERGGEAPRDSVAEDFSYWKRGGICC